MAASDKQNLNTSKGHQGLTLVGATFVTFGVVFIGFYSNNFWFSLNLAWLGIPTVVLAGAIACVCLMLLEAKPGCRLFWPILRGKPPVVFRRWLVVDNNGFSHGLRHVAWEAVDEVALTFFGNLEIKSRAVCGTQAEQPEVVFKFPFAPAAQQQQQEFIDALQAHRPSVGMNKRLEKRLKSPIVRGQNLIQSFSSIVMLVLLIDFGHSSFYYLEMLKHYYLADVDGLAGQAADAASELARADELRAHPLPVSYITKFFLNVGANASGVSTARADALWHMGRYDDAIAESRKAIDTSPESFRTYLHYAQYLEETGHLAEAEAQMEKAVEKHKNSLLPRLYLMANAIDQKKGLSGTVYKQSMDELTDKVFESEPYWPPGGNSYIADVYYSRDIYFILDRLLGTKLEPQSKPAK